MQTLYCSDNADLPTARPSAGVQGMFTDSNHSWLSNSTDLQHQRPTDHRSVVARRDTEAVYLVVKYYVYQGIIPAFMLVGVVGNVLSLTLSVRCRRQMSSLERSSTVGLAALVTSDLLFCAVGLPQLFLPRHSDPSTPPESVTLARFSFYYEHYRGPLHNVFLLCSTWIMAIITAERYLAVSQPIRARLLTIRLHRTFVFYVAVFVLSGLVALPLFLKYRTVEGDCFPGCQCLFIVPTSTFGSLEARRVYNVAWMTVGVILPLSCLLVTGTKLVRALRALRQRNAIDNETQERHQRVPSRSSPVTTTVVGTAVTFILLVCPSIVVESVALVLGVQSLSDSQLDIYRTIIVLLNLCQTIKFAGNFLFFVRLTGADCDKDRRPSTALLLYQFQTCDAARSNQQTELRPCDTFSRRPTKTTLISGGSNLRRQAATPV